MSILPSAQPPANDAERSAPDTVLHWLRSEYERISALPDTPENRRRRFEMLLALRSDEEEWRKLQLSTDELSAQVELQNRRRLQRILGETGWSCEAEVPVMGKEGLRFRLDLLVSHPDLPGAPGECGAIEVKDAVGPAGRDYVDAVKQAIDYVGSRTIDGRTIAWAAVYPVVNAYLWVSRSEIFGKPYTFREDMAFLSGVFELSSKHFKVHALFHEPRSCMPRGDRLVLIYLNRHVVWCEQNGFRGEARKWLCGKRQVGGQRL